MESQIDKAVAVLKRGGLVIYPTETCYGAGVDANNQKAVDKLLAYKTRREGKPLSIAVTDQTMAGNFVKLNATAKNLYRQFLPGPLTVVSAGKHRIAAGVESETGTLGIRIPDHPVPLELVRQLGRPITATSANVSYKPKPYSISQLFKQTRKKQQSLIDFVIDTGTLPKRPASTVVDTTLDDPLILRQGQLLPTIPTKSFTTTSAQATSNLAKTLMLKHWNDLQVRPLMFLLIGDLGAGKTQFAKGIGEFLGIKTPITSPTYTIEKEYAFTRHRVSGKFLHLDAWRLHHLAELDELKLLHRLKPKTVIAVEWAGRTLAPLLDLAKKTNSQIIILKIKQRKIPNQRLIKLLFVGGR